MSPPDEDQSLQRYIIRANIERFRTLLSETRDEAERRKIRELLEAEEAKLALGDDTSRTS